MKCLFTLYLLQFLTIPISMQNMKYLLDLVGGGGGGFFYWKFWTKAKPWLYQDGNFFSRKYSLYTVLRFNSQKKL